MSDTNFAERFGIRDELLNEIFRFRRGKSFVEVDDQQMAHAQRLNESDFMLGRAEQTRRGLRAQNFFRMGIESNHDRSAAGSSGMLSRRRNDRLMPAMNPIENTNG